MSKPQLFILDEATINLYPAGADGRTIMGPPIWIGACAETLTLSSRLETLRLGATAAKYKSNYHVDETHEIRIDRLWVLRSDDLADYALERNRRYVMEITWRDETTHAWYRNIYFGVTARSYDRTSNSIMEFMANQMWDAEYYEMSSGREALEPLPESGISTDQILFVHEEQVNPSDPVTSYLTGIYRWPESRRTVSAKIIGRSGAGNPSNFTLEVNGILTAYTVTLPLGGSAGAEVQNTLTFATTLPANQDVRWKCTSGPPVANGPYAVALVMTIED